MKNEGNEAKEHMDEEIMEIELEGRAIACRAGGCRFESYYLRS